MRKQALLVVASAVLLAASQAPAEAQSAPPETFEWFDVQIDVRERPARAARLVFGLVNGDGKPDNAVVVRSLAIAGGTLGDPVKKYGSVTDVDGGFRLDDQPHHLTKVVYQQVTVGTRIGFKVGVTRQHPSKGADDMPPDQFSLAVLDGGSNAGYLRSNDPTTANALVTIDLAPGAAPRVYRAHPSAPGKPEAWTAVVTPTTEPR
jgi:hypothetical protein